MTNEELSKEVDQYHRARALRLETQHKTEELKSVEDQLANSIIRAMQEANLTVAGGQVGVVKLKTTKEPTVEDWGLFYAHVQTTGSFDLLHKRLGAGAIKARWDDNEQVPGVTTYEVSKLTVGKAHL